MRRRHAVKGIFVNSNKGSFMLKKIMFGSALFATALSGSALADDCTQSGNTYTCTDGQYIALDQGIINVGTDTGQISEFLFAGNIQRPASPWLINATTDTANTPFALTMTGSGIINTTTYFTNTNTTFTQGYEVTIPWITNQTGGTFNWNSDANFILGGIGAPVTYPITVTGGADSNINFLDTSATYSTVASDGGDPAALTNTTSAALLLDGGTHNIFFNGTLTKAAAPSNFVQITNSPVVNVNLAGSGLSGAFMDVAGADSSTLTISKGFAINASTFDNANGTYRNFDNFVINSTAGTVSIDGATNDIPMTLAYQGGNVTLTNSTANKTLNYASNVTGNLTVTGTSTFTANFPENATYNGAKAFNGTATVINAIGGLTNVGTIIQTGGSIAYSFGGNLTVGAGGFSDPALQTTGGANSTYNFNTTNYTAVGTTNSIEMIQLNGGTHTINLNGVVTRSGDAGGLVKLENTPNLNVNLVYNDGVNAIGLDNTFIDAATAQSSVFTITGNDADAAVQFNTAAFNATSGDFRNFETFAINMPAGASVTLDSANSIAGDVTPVNWTVSGGSVIATNPYSLNGTDFVLASGAQLLALTDQNLNSLTTGDQSILDMSQSVVTITVNSNYSPAQAPNIKFTGDGSGNSKLSINGTVTLNAGANFILSDSAALNSLNVTLIESTGAITADTDYLDFQEEHHFFDLDSFVVNNPDTGNHSLVALLKMNGNQIANEVTSPNSKAVGAAIDSLSNTSPLHLAVKSLSLSDIESAVKQLTGETTVSYSQSLLSVSDALHSVTSDRLDMVSNSSGYALAALSEGRAIQVAGVGNSGLASKKAQSDTNLWTKAIGGTSHQGKYKTYDGGRGEMAGFVLGGDHKFASDLTAGALVGYVNSKFKTRSVVSSKEADTVNFGVYGNYSVKNMFDVRASVMHAMHDVDGKRTVAFSGYNANPTSSFKGNSTVGQIELAKAFKVDSLTVEPYVSYSYTHQHMDAFTEANGNGAELHFNADNTDYNNYGAGVKASHKARVAGTNVELFAKGGYLYNDGDTVKRNTLVFAQGGNTFSVSGQGVRKNTALVGLGFSVDLPRNMVVGAGYDGSFASASRTHIGNVNFKFHF